MPPKASQKLICVGKILGAHGVRGLARLGSHTTEPKDFAAYGPVFDKTGARSWTLSLNSWNKTHFIGALSGVNTREDVEKLKGTDLYIPRDLLPDIKGDGYYYADLIGLEARAADGSPLGHVKNMLNYGAGDILELTAPDGTTALYPFSDLTVPEVHVADGYLVLCPPDIQE